ncbi:septation ring formation regulator EzrA [Salipaludibacillus neizhouensis]|uniref:Septation ring formation regulator EzrA n=2 Tax=Salipaludibacillus neizhouensis TaxID=885475 RepID=A0A3A9K307_9BACI|nr:septation ring formation regulator EzrA [Salipaludibacillus neizhouensis]
MNIFMKMRWRRPHMFMYVIYGSILLFLIIIIYGAWSRKKLYKEVDRLENKKMKMMNEPITEELSRIKGLRMSGETEERFGQWREEWDNIVTIQLPDMEEKLFDIEELANKYRFFKAKQYVRFVDTELDAVQQQMKEMVQEVDQLIHSEEQNRKDIDGVKDLFHETKKKLWVQKGTLGQAASTFDQKLKEIQLMFESFDEETEKGNYFQARELLLKMSELLKEYQDVMMEVPQYLVRIEKEIPKQLEDLEKGFTEMEKEGYSLHHFSYQLQVKEMKRRLIVLLPLVESLNLEEVKEPIETTDSEINDIYEKLEHEVLSKNFVEKELQVLREHLSKLPQSYQSLSAEIETLKLNYQLTEDDDKQQIKIEKNIKELFNQLSVIEDAMEEKKQSFTTLRSMTQDFKIELDNVESEVKEMHDNFQHLRSDERKAEETIRQMQTDLTQGQKRLKQSNIPGVPELLLMQLDEAEEILNKALESLDQIPISIQNVNKHVEEAKKHIDSCLENLDQTIKKAKKAELVIQYGNRYRSEYDHVNIKLLQAEDRFRHYLYEESLEFALEGVELVDPKVLEKVKELEKLQVSYY